MKTVNVVFAVHNHQPIGNFETVFEEAHLHAYRPFLDLLMRHPSIRFTQHWTGPLLEWLLKRHPETVELLQELVRRGQLELLTGSYYEAILAVIPEQDRIGQIRKLSDTLHQVFGVTPRGMWLAERVWEQPLVASLVKAGVEFVVVDDTHFKHAGVQEEQLVGYFMTEEQGATIKVIPIDKHLRYTIPFRPLEETLHYLQRMATGQGNHVIVHADDGEKFGVWPKTFRHVYEEGWLASFCAMLEEHQDWIRTIHCATMVDSWSPEGMVYLPTASYPEMLKWVLPPTSFLQLERFERMLRESDQFDGNSMFVRGGYWRNFLSKYPEANHMHKKMLRVSRRAHAVTRTGEVGNAGEILDHVWAGQCNDPYWHGVFGGLYLPNLRFPVYRNLLEAERLLDRAEKPPPLRIEETDFDCDGAAEVLIESDLLNLYLKPSLGGSLVELDFKPAAFNLLDILSRREEGYHRRLLAMSGGLPTTAHGQDDVLVKEEGLENHLHFDWYRHASLVDHFLGPETTLDAFARCRYLELGDFVNLPYRVSVEADESHVAVILRREGALWFGDRPHKVTVEKTIRYAAGSSGFTVDYRLENGEPEPLDIWFGVEVCAGLMAGNAHDRYYEMEGRTLHDRKLASMAEERQAQSITLVDEWIGMRTHLSCDREATLWRFPLETVSLSEAGLERIYQGSVLMPHWRLTLANEWRVRLTQSMVRR